MSRRKRTFLKTEFQRMPRTTIESGHQELIGEIIRTNSLFRVYYARITKLLNMVTSSLTGVSTTARVTYY